MWTTLLKSYSCKKLQKLIVAVNEESEDEDEGYNSITEGSCRRRGRKLREEEMKFVEEDTKDELKEKLFLLKEAYDDLKGQ